MAQLRGGHTAEMRALAGRFRREADTMNGVISSLHGETSSSEAIWRGPAADRFRGDWREFKPGLDRLVVALNEAARAIDANAQHIDDATA